jgi:uncharacterized protein YecT (DUF1311 family)
MRRRHAKVRELPEDLPFNDNFANFKVTSMHLLGLFFIVLGIVSPTHSALAVNPAPSFDCAKAQTAVETLICSDAELAEDDTELARLFAELRDGYDAARRQSLIKGQRLWLKLVPEACVLRNFPIDKAELDRSRDWIARHSDDDESDDDKPPLLAKKMKCLRSVYEERTQELEQQLEIQKLEKAGSFADGPINIDEILDTKRDLAIYFPESRSAMHNIWDADESNGERIPATCRELFTLSAGFWGYDGTTAGDNTESYARTTCLFMIFSAQRYAGVRPDPTNIKFDDVTLYSIEFGCLIVDNNCVPEDKHIRTFSEEQTLSHIRIIEGRVPYLSYEIDDQIGSTLIVDHGNFCIHGINFTVEHRATGNFTNSGRQEALLALSYIPVQGTARGNFLIIAYFDSKNNAIRPEDIEMSSRLRLTSSNMK